MAETWWSTVRRREKETIGDVGVPQAFGEEREDVELAWCQVRGMRGRRAPRPARDVPTAEPPQAARRAAPCAPISTSAPAVALALEAPHRRPGRERPRRRTGIRARASDLRPQGGSRRAPARRARDGAGVHRRLVEPARRLQTASVPATHRSTRCGSGTSHDSRRARSGAPVRTAQARRGRRPPAVCFWAELLASSTRPRKASPDLPGAGIAAASANLRENHRGGHAGERKTASASTDARRGRRRPIFLDGDLARARPARR